VVAFETDQVNNVASTAVIEYMALSPTPTLPHAFVLPVIAAPAEKLHVTAETVIVVVDVLLQPVVGLV
jgi:hypothetical protein